MHAIRGQAGSGPFDQLRIGDGSTMARDSVRIGIAGQQIHTTRHCLPGSVRRDLVACTIADVGIAKGIDEDRVAIGIGAGLALLAGGRQDGVGWQVQRWLLDTLVAKRGDDWHDRRFGFVIGAFGILAAIGVVAAIGADTGSYSRQWRGRFVGARLAGHCAAALPKAVLGKTRNPLRPPGVPADRPLRSALFYRSERSKKPG